MAKRKPKLLGAVICPLDYVPGTTWNPIGLSTDTRCVVTEVLADRVRVDREDGRGTGYYLNRDAIRRFDGQEV